MYHDAVMLEAAINGLSVKPAGTYVDLTFGGGGHSRAILERLDNGRLIAFDQDEDTTRNVPEDRRLLFLNHNFCFLKNLLKWHDSIPVDGILADLGVSSHQIDESTRGFSTRFDGPLDMRMNRRAEKRAADVIKNYSYEELADIFYLYGELKNARKIAEEIVRQRSIKVIETTGQLTELLKPFSARAREMKFMAQVFQALRIEVNGELDALKAMLEQSREVLRPGGRLVVISYHSLEDRLVKNFIRSGNFCGKVEKDFYGNIQGPFRVVSKMLTASDEEIKRNKRSRSARLRIAEKI